MELLSFLIILGIIILVFWSIRKFLKGIFFPIPKRKTIFLPHRIKANADREFNKRLQMFKRKHKRKPTRNELFRMIISISHNHIKGHGRHGHWGRQKIRKYLLEKHQVVNRFVMR